MPAVAISTASLPRSLPRFDLENFRPSIRPSDVFLCSYPKSGTTWLGFLLANIIKPDLSEQLNLKNFNRFVPDVNLLYTKRGSLHEHALLPSPRLMLCHALFEPVLPKVVYVMRDPRDVMVSYWHYQKFLGRGEVGTLADFLRRDDHWPCHWDAHVASWLCPRKHPQLLIVTYEQMHADGAGVLRQVLSHAGIRASDERIALAVHAARFDQMRKSEEQFGVHGKCSSSDERFVRKGQIGGWQDEMTPEAQRILEDRYGEVMRQVGYDTEL